MRPTQPRSDRRRDARREVDDASGARLALVLDVDDLVVGRCASARELRPWFGVAKVGLELYSAVGPDAIDGADRPRLRRVRRPEAARHPDHRAARRPGSLGSLGARYLTLHALGGVDDAARRRRGPARGRRRAGLRRADRAGGHRAHQRRRRARRTSCPSGCSSRVEAGCGGIVCAARDVARSPPATARGCAIGRAGHPSRRAPDPRPGPAGDATRGARRRRRPAGDRSGRHRRPTTRSRRRPLVDSVAT